ncbi:MAG: VIT1/CCC1 transporter family protein, partial [Candidatus Entotheonellia bacterium]
VRFWQDFFRMPIETLDLRRRVKLRLILAICWLFGETAIHLVLEAIEVYGVRKYLSIWEVYKEGPLGEAVRGVLEDEFEHEDKAVTELTQRKINPENIRNIFLGFNDGLVEILGAVSGFFAAFQDVASILVASVTVAVAGSLSMAAGAFVASSSEKEVQAIAEGKQNFLGKPSATADTGQGALRAALLVGISYFLGTLVPVLPVAFGAKSVLIPVMSGGAVVLLVSFLVAFLSGMDVKKRVLTNLVILAAAVGVTYAIGMATKSVWGISLP